MQWTPGAPIETHGQLALAKAELKRMRKAPSPDLGALNILSTQVDEYEKSLKLKSVDGGKKENEPLKIHKLTLEKVRPVADYIIAIKVKEERQSEGGIVLPESATDPRLHVFAVGPDVKRCKVGDRVLVVPRTFDMKCNMVMPGVMFDGETCTKHGAIMFQDDFVSAVIED